MNDFTFQNQTKVYFGKKQLHHLHEEVLKYGNKVLVATGGKFILELPAYKNTMEELKNNGIEVYELQDVEPNPRHTTVNKGVAICKKENIAVVIAIGGGSTIDCCKAISATALSETDNVWDLISGEVKWNQALPIIAMPTIASTGSEMDKSCVISNIELNVKKGLSSDLIRPTVSFLNPENTFTVPAGQTACGGFDIFVHLIDMNYFVDAPKNPLQYNVVETLLKVVKEYTPKCIQEPTNYEARGTMLWAASWALNSFCTSGFKTLPSNHAIEKFSAFNDLTHGLGLSIVMPRWMTYLLDKDETVVDDFARFAINVMGVTPTGNKKEEAKAGIAALETYLTEELHMPRTLTEVGIDDSQFEEMAFEATYKQGVLKGYRHLTTEDIVNIYKMCL